MIYEYFRKYPKDIEFYEQYLKSRLPQKILDVHTHINLQEHLKDIPQSRIDSDWAFQTGMQMTTEDAQHYISLMFPDIDYRMASFPLPIKEGDMVANNQYIQKSIQQKNIEYGLMCIKPQWSVEYIEEQLKTNGFVGVKPYPDMLSGVKGADISIFDFFPKEHIELVEKLNKCVVMHLPRAGRMPDPDNIRELREIRQRYPKLKMIIAHFGRCFMLPYFKSAIEALGEDIHSFWFDTAAVLNPQVFEAAMDVLDPDKILYGSDQPIFLWHGKRRWTDEKYFNLCREDFPWNKHEEGFEAEKDYTFFVYEQMNNILNALEKTGMGDGVKCGIFGGNAKKLLDGCIS